MTHRNGITLSCGCDPPVLPIAPAAMFARLLAGPYKSWVAVASRFPVGVGLSAAPEVADHW